jgi:tRNA A-37 threonylcarbamoyl transferase component Bud32
METLSEQQLAARYAVARVLRTVRGRTSDVHIVSTEAAPTEPRYAVKCIALPAQPRDAPPSDVERRATTEVQLLHEIARRRRDRRDGAEYIVEVVAAAVCTAPFRWTRAAVLRDGYEQRLIEIVLDYGGVSLAELTTPPASPIDSDEGDAIVQSSIRAVQYAHSLGVEHNDLHAGNLLHRGTNVALIDFGNATLSKPDAVSTRDYEKLGAVFAALIAQRRLAVSPATRALIAALKDPLRSANRRLLQASSPAAGEHRRPSLTSSSERLASKAKKPRPQEAGVPPAAATLYVPRAMAHELAQRVRAATDANEQLCIDEFPVLGAAASAPRRSLAAFDAAKGAPLGKGGYGSVDEVVYRGADGVRYKMALKHVLLVEPAPDASETATMVASRTLLFVEEAMLQRLTSVSRYSDSLGELALFPGRWPFPRLVASWTCGYNAFILMEQIEAPTFFATTRALFAHYAVAMQAHVGTEYLVHRRGDAAGVREQFRVTVHLASYVAALRAVAYAFDVLDTLGIVHNDSHPNNVAVDVAADPMVATVFDFGLAYSQDERPEPGTNMFRFMWRLLSSGLLPQAIGEYMINQFADTTALLDLTRAPFRPTPLAPLRFTYTPGKWIIETRAFTANEHRRPHLDRLRQYPIPAFATPLRVFAGASIDRYFFAKIDAVVVPASTVAAPSTLSPVLPPPPLQNLDVP